jgi:hypothetical protein
MLEQNPTEQAVPSDYPDWPRTPAGAGDQLRRLLAQFEQLWERYGGAAGTDRFLYGNEDCVFVDAVARAVGLAVRQAQEAADFLKAALTVWSPTTAAPRSPNEQGVTTQ